MGVYNPLELFQTFLIERLEGHVSYGQTPFSPFAYDPTDRRLIYVNQSTFVAVKDGELKAAHKISEYRICRTSFLFASWTVKLIIRRSCHDKPRDLYALFSLTKSVPGASSEIKTLAKPQQSPASHPSVSAIIMTI